MAVDDLKMDPGLLASFGGGGFGQGPSPVEVQRLNLKALLPFLQLRGPNLETERAKGTVAALRGKYLRPADHSDKYGQRGGAALAVADFTNNLVGDILEKRALEEQARKEADLAAASTVAGKSALKSIGAADDEPPPADPGRAMGTPLTQDVPKDTPPPQQPPAQQMQPGGVMPQQDPMQGMPEQGLQMNLSPSQLLAAYQAMMAIQGKGSGFGG